MKYNMYQLFDPGSVEECCKGLNINANNWISMQHGTPQSLILSPDIVRSVKKIITTYDEWGRITADFFFTGIVLRFYEKDTGFPGVWLIITASEE